MPGPAAACWLLTTCWAGNVLAMSKWPNIPARYWRQESKMDYSPPHQSFICTPETLSGSDTRQSIEAWLMSLQPDSPASHSATPANSRPEMMSETAGRIPFVLLERSGRSGFFWKTLQACLPGVTATLERYSGSWPRAGMMLSGVCYRRLKWERRISGIGSGLWPTPDAQNGRDGNILRKAAKSGDGLATAVKMWPTPRASDGDHGGSSQRDSRGNLGLTEAVHHWPTPTARLGVARGPQAKRYTNPERSNDLDDAVAYHNPENGGQLNPDWEEWLMGWPIGWTALEPLAADRFREWLRQFGGF